MKRIVLIGIVGTFLMGLTSCGGGHICDAYGGQANYTKYKADQSKKVNITFNKKIK